MNPEFLSTSSEVITQHQDHFRNLTEKNFHVLAEVLTPKHLQKVTDRTQDEAEIRAASLAVERSLFNFPNYTPELNGMIGVFIAAYCKMRLRGYADSRGVSLSPIRCVLATYSIF